MRMRNWLVYFAALAAVVIYVRSVDAGSAQFLLFIGLFTPSMLWLLGLTRTPRFVLAARKLARQRGKSSPQPHALVAPAEYRYPRKLAARVVIWCLVLLLLGLTIFVGLAMGDKAGPVLLILGGGTALHGWIAYRLPHLCIHVGPEGLKSVQLLGTVRMAWDEVLVLVDREYRYANGVRMGSAVQLYSAVEKLDIGDQLLGRDELLATVHANVNPIELPS